MRDIIKFVFYDSNYGPILLVGQLSSRSVLSGGLLQSYHIILMFLSYGHHSIGFITGSHHVHHLVLTINGVSVWSE